MMVAAEQTEKIDSSQQSLFYLLIESVRIFYQHYNTHCDPLLRAYSSQRLQHDLKIATLVLSEKEISRACILGKLSASNSNGHSQTIHQPRVDNILGLEASLPTQIEIVQSILDGLKNSRYHNGHHP